VQAWIYGILAGVVVLALMGIAYTIGSNSGDDEPATTQAETTATDKTGETTDAETGGGPGAELFASNCGSCHTLEAAGTTGATGPDLDALAPDEAQVLAAIENGGAGSGAMPANIVTGADAQEVAAFVASSAGN
jgi:mono/diheme cytochrome c family protein